MGFKRPRVPQAPQMSTAAPRRPQAASQPEDLDGEFVEATATPQPEDLDGLEDFDATASQAAPQAPRSSGAAASRRLAELAEIFGEVSAAVEAPSPPPVAAHRARRGRNGSPAERLRIEERRELVARLAAKRLSYREIAEVLASKSPPIITSPATISKDLKAIQAQWREAARDSIDNLKAQQLAETGEIKRVAFLKFETTGDPRFLNVILSAHSREAQLLGLDRPRDLRLEVNASPLTQRLSELSDAELRELAASRVYQGGDVLDVTPVLDGEDEEDEDDEDAFEDEE